MISNFQISNFKSIKKINLSTSKFNIFIGEPNVGKSNIIESLALISSFQYSKHANDSNIISKDFVRFNNIFNLFYDNSPQNEITIDLNNFRTQLTYIDENLKFKISKTSNNEVIRALFETRLGESGNSLGINRKHYDVAKNNLYPIKYYRFKPLNKFMSQKFEFLIPPHGNNLMTIIQSNPTLRELFSTLLKPYGFKLMIRPQQNEIELLKEEGSITIAYPFNLSADTFQHLFLIISALKTNKNSVILLEEPETHLFAYYTKFLAETLAQDQSQNQFFITTHNPYFLSSILEKTPKDDLSLFLVFFENYETKVRKLSDEDISNVLSWEAFFLNFDEFLE